LSTNDEVIQSAFCEHNRTEKVPIGMNLCSNYKVGKYRQKCAYLQALSTAKMRETLYDQNVTSAS
jgi:hypothetical protein